MKSCVSHARSAALALALTWNGEGPAAAPAVLSAARDPFAQPFVRSLFHPSSEQLGLETIVGEMDRATPPCPPIEAGRKAFVTLGWFAQGVEGVDIRSQDALLRRRLRNGEGQLFALPAGRPLQLAFDRSEASVRVPERPTGPSRTPITPDVLQGRRGPQDGNRVLARVRTPHCGLSPSSSQLLIGVGGGRASDNRKRPSGGARSAAKVLMFPTELSRITRGNARVRVVHAAQSTPRASLWVGEATLFTELAHGRGSEPLDVNAGALTDFSIAIEGRAERFPLDAYTLEAGRFYTFVLGSPSKGRIMLSLIDETPAGAQAVVTDAR